VPARPPRRGDRAGRAGPGTAARPVREEHPDVIIGDGGFGTWQARIPKSDGETVITRYTLRELLDKLGELTEGRSGQPSEAPD